jgi:subtilisin family serine protease
MEGTRRRDRRHRVLRLEPIEPRLLLSADWTGLAQVRSEYALTGRGQTVAVIDTGIDYDHLALGGGFGPGYRVVGGANLADNSSDASDAGPDAGHGTFVAGIIGSSDPAHLGVAPGVDLVALRVTDSSGQSSLGLVDEALRWVNVHRNDFQWPITTVNLSLGTDGNFTSPPDWAFLEPDLKQLQADGIFVSVAAGNDFASYGTAGVDYPAASPYVVPAAAGTADGALAGFSQRDAACLVAPGVGLVSTVPDIGGSPNGLNDNFAPSSGTSTAAAYLAGASVLLRQAYQEAGKANVSEQTLYQTMLSTADTILDPATGQDYHRLNLARAVDSVLSVAQPVAAPAPAAPAPAVPSPAAPAAAGTNWGTVAQQTFNGYSIDAQGQWFSVTAANSGILTIEPLASSAPGGDCVDVFDASGKVVAASFGRDQWGRIDMPVVAGDTYRLHVFTVGGPAAGDEVDFRVTNLVSISGTTAHVAASGSQDEFAMAASALLEFTIDGVVYSWNRSLVSSVTFAGGVYG